MNIIDNPFHPILWEIITSNWGWLLLLRSFLTGSIFAITGLLILPFFDSWDKRLEGIVNRLLFSVSLGAVSLIFSMIVLNAVSGYPINRWGIILLVSSVWITLSGYWFGKGIKFQEMMGRLSAEKAIVAVLLLIVFIVSFSLRIENTLKYPDRLLQTDTYRNIPPTRHIVQYGDLTRYRHLIIGEVPIYRMQGAYVFIAMLSQLSGYDAWSTWKYGAILLGTLGVINGYFLGTFVYGGDPYAGLITALFLGGVSIHVLRTSAALCETLALFFAPLAILFFLEVLRQPTVENGILFGLFFMGMSAMDQADGIFLIPFFLTVCIFSLSVGWFYNRNTNFIVKTIKALTVSLSVGIIFLLVWRFTYMGTSLSGGLYGVLSETSGKISSPITILQIGNVIHKTISPYIWIPAVAGLLSIPYLIYLSNRIETSFGLVLKGPSFYSTTVFSIFSVIYYPLAMYLSNWNYPVVIGRIYRYMVLPSILLSIASTLPVYLLKNEFEKIAARYFA